MTKNPINLSLSMFMLVVIAAILSWYYVSTSNQYLLDKQALRRMPDMVAYQVHLKEYDENGQIKYDMISDKMSHLQANDRYLFQNPVITIQDKERKAPWQITAKKAISTNGAEQIELIESVRLHQSLEEQKYNDILTEQLFYKPKQKFAFTNKPIEFHQPGALIKATGMQAELDNKHVKLLKNAQGSFVHETA